MTFTAPPPFAAFDLRGALDGFEVAYFREEPGLLLIDGYTAAVENGRPYAISYSLRIDSDWRTRVAHVSARTLHGHGEVRLESDGRGRWWAGEKALPELDGLLDVDLEASSLTNALPVRRLGLAPGERADAPAAYVRALDLRVERLDQEYARVADGSHGQRYDYLAVADGFRCVIEYDASGLVVDYPGIAVRAA